MNIFYLPEIDPAGATLSEEESGHAIRVLRLKEHDPVTLVNGKGILFEAEISVAHPKKCQLRIIRFWEEYEKRSYTIHLAVAPTKNQDRMEWLVEKATEIGLDEFTPLLCRFSERKQIQHNRLEKIAVAAMKQSLKAYLPGIREMIAFEQFISHPFPGQKFIAHCYPGDKPFLKDLVDRDENVLVLIGPEGDFSPEEVTLAIAAGFHEVSLGRSRLRTETAALAACHTVALCNF